MESSVSELLLAGSRLMFIGMSIVFLFLARTASDAFAPPASAIEDTELVAAITAAVHRYRNPK